MAASFGLGFVKGLEQLIARGASLGLITGCVTKGLWAPSPAAAAAKWARPVKGFSAGNNLAPEFHSRFVLVERGINGAMATVEASIQHLLITAEMFQSTRFPMERLTEDPPIEELLATGRIMLQRNIWIPSGGKAPISHETQHLCFAEGNQSGYSTRLQVLAVTPDQRLWAGCGLHLERIPHLCLGSLVSSSLAEVVERAVDDFLKIWLYVERTERILKWVRERKPGYQLPAASAHRCETRLHLSKDPVARAILRRQNQKAV